MASFLRLPSNSVPAPATKNRHRSVWNHWTVIWGGVALGVALLVLGGWLSLSRRHAAVNRRASAGYENLLPRGTYVLRMRYLGDYLQSRFPGHNCLLFMWCNNPAGYVHTACARGLREGAPALPVTVVPAPAFPSVRGFAETPAYDDWIAAYHREVLRAVEEGSNTTIVVCVTSPAPKPACIEAALARSRATLALVIEDYVDEDRVWAEPLVSLIRGGRLLVIMNIPPHAIDCKQSDMERLFRTSYGEGNFAAEQVRRDFQMLYWLLDGQNVETLMDRFLSGDVPKAPMKTGAE